MAYWLVKSEPYKWSWDDQLKADTGMWQKEVRNYQARNNIREMKPGDEVMFYHSNEGKEIVGIMTVESDPYPDPRDESGKFTTIDVKAKTSLSKPVTLAQIKDVPDLDNIALVKQSRLSVMPITDAEWRVLCQMGGL